jgi:hypothetical protein
MKVQCWSANLCTKAHTDCDPIKPPNRASTGFRRLAAQAVFASELIALRLRYVIQNRCVVTSDDMQNLRLRASQKNRDATLRCGIAPVARLYFTGVLNERA